MRRAAPIAAWACGLAIALAQAAAPLTEAEKQLLMSGMSASAASERGKEGDAAALERIVAIGDPALVQSFDYGLRAAQVNAMPPAVEAVVAAHFDDARVGAALRALSPRYRTRALFDLHYARIQKAYESREPSFEQILRTDQPGIEEPLLAAASRFPSSAGQLNPVASFLARRKYPGAIPLLVASMEATYAVKAAAPQYNAALDALLEYPSVDAWRRADAEVERLKREGKIEDASYAAARQKLDRVLADPDAVLARMKGRDVFAVFVARRDALQPNAREIAILQVSDLPRYVDEQARFLAKQEAIAAELADEGVDYEIASAYARLGTLTRFRLRDTRRALPFLEKAAKGRDLIGQVALADAYEIELHDKANALRAYELALRTASETGRRITPYARPGDAMNEFWKAWLAAEIAYLRSGTPFRGRVPENVVGGFWEAMWVWARGAASDFPQWASAQGGVAAFAASGGRALALPVAPPGEAPPGPKELAARLAAMPASRLPLFVTLRHISELPNADAILRELARHDPSGYWTTVALGTALYYDRRGAAGREEASKAGLDEALPGLRAAGSPTPLAAAARRYLQTRELRIVERKP